MPVTIDGYPLDLVVSEEHSLTSEITEHPVEDGSDISDNIRIKPRELTLTNAVVSDTPIGAMALDPTRILGDTLPPPSADAYRLLEKIWTDRKIVTIVTKLKKYENMALESLTVPQDAKSAGGLIFTAHFKEVRIVKNSRVTVKLPNTRKQANLGLSLDNIIAGQHILWRKGKPPGLSPSTVPLGVIVQTEVVTVEDRGGKPGRILHSSGKPLTPGEQDDFVKDLNRDTAIMTNRGLYRAQQQNDKNGTVIERGIKMSNYSITHPGEQVEPSMFGLEQDPKGNWIAK